MYSHESHGSHKVNIYIYIYLRGERKGWWGVSKVGVELLLAQIHRITSMSDLSYQIVFKYVY